MARDLPAVRKSNFPYPWHEDKLPRTQAAGASSSSSFHPGVARSPEVVVDEVPPPRESDRWGDTICAELLRESPAAFLRRTLRRPKRTCCVIV